MGDSKYRTQSFGSEGHVLLHVWEQKEMTLPSFILMLMLAFKTVSSKNW